MDLATLLERVENTMVARFEEARAGVKHRGDRGENVEAILREFLSSNLPKRFGVTKGEIMTRTGQHSYAADIIIYDAVSCPVLFAGNTQVLPIEGVYGVIEVKSRLSKAELADALKKLASFKLMNPPNLHARLHRSDTQPRPPSAPFGIVVGFELADNSLSSLMNNTVEICRDAAQVEYRPNLIAVLGSGLVLYGEMIGNGPKINPYLTTDEMLAAHLLTQPIFKSKSQREIRIATVDLGGRTFGRFFVYLTTMLERMRLATPDLLHYMPDPTVEDSLDSPQAPVSS